MVQELVDYLFGAASFMPHGYCLLWRPDLVALHAVSDLLIAGAYLAIPVAILVFMRRRGTVAPEHARVAALFVTFIVACAMTHLAGLLTLWVPAYGLQGLVKAVTALVSVATAIALWPLMPRLVALPSAADLMAANTRLAEETQARRALVDQLQQVNRDLEERVARRTRELSEAMQRFEVALSSSGITASVQDADLRYRWIHNPRFGLTAEEMIGRTDRELMPADVADRMTAIKSATLEAGEPREEEVRIPGGPGGGDLFIRLHAAPERDESGTPVGIIAAVVDITAEHRRAAELETATVALAEANERFDQALTGSSITMVRQDADLRYTWIFNPPPGMVAEEVLGRTDDEALPETTARVVAPVKRRVLANATPERVEVAMRLGERTSWYDLRVEPLLDEGRVVGLTSVAIDISAQKEYHHHLRVVMRELTHRSKNLLAVVQGIARQTAQSVDGLPAFVERFGARLQALARAHDILVDESWRGAAVEELISTQLGHVIERSADRIIAKGPKVLLKPEAAQNVALALHELSTNAAKYGALSGESGTVSVAWGPVTSPAGDQQFEIVWRETGGPPATPPARKGFGSVMIERLVPRAIDGTSDLAYDDEGLTWTLRFPRRYLVDLDTPAELA
jgi:PAS domain S-box-containing protein